MTTPLRLTSLLRADPDMAQVLSAEASVDAWVRVEVALARAQADVGLLPSSVADEIAEVAGKVAIDAERLWRESVVVGYPILPLVRQLDAAVGASARGRLHLGATTQDVMDTGLALQLRDAADVLLARTRRIGDALATQAGRYAEAVMPARTHAQVAVPTTFGAKLAVYLGELDRHRRRLSAARRSVSQVSLFGAGGTSAGYGPRAASVRENVARQLGLEVPAVPWHVARDGIAELMLAGALASATCTRLAREVVDLSRNEIAELSEADGHHRGASSTMPQKANPIASESIIGLGTYCASVAPAMLRAMEAGHERAAGEWQLEWEVVPEALAAASAALYQTAELVESWQVDTTRMRDNARRFVTELVAERCMVVLVDAVGREVAHDLVYEVLRDGDPTADAVRERLLRLLREKGVEPPENLFEPEGYLGEARSIASRGVELWEGDRGASEPPRVPDDEETEMA